MNLFKVQPVNIRETSNGKIIFLFILSALWLSLVIMLPLQLLGVFNSYCELQYPGGGFTVPLSIPSAYSCGDPISSLILTVLVQASMLCLALILLPYYLFAPLGVLIIILLPFLGLYFLIHSVRWFAAGIEFFMGVDKIVKKDKDNEIDVDW